MCAGFKYIKDIGLYIDNSNVDILVGKNFVNNSKTLPKIEELLNKFKKPIKIIGAELAGFRIARDIYFTHANESKELYIIKGSGHTFDENESEEELFTETLKFIKNN